MRLLSCIILLLLTISFVSASYPDETIYDGLVSYWPLDGNASDAYGNNHGTIYGYPEKVAGILGDAYYFGTDDMIRYASGVYSAYTINFWTKNSGAANTVYRHPVAFRHPTNSDAFLQLMYQRDVTNNLLYRVRGYNTPNLVTNVYAASPVDLSQKWNMITLTSNGSVAKMYIDGVFQNQGGGFEGDVMKSWGNIFVFGSSNTGSWYYGSIDEAGLWNRELTSGEIIELYQDGDAKPYPFMTMIRNESIARDEIEAGIKNALPGASIMTDKRVLLSHNQSSTIIAKFDKVARYGSKYWAFNYITEGETNISVNNMSMNFYIWQDSELYENDVRLAVETLINSTK